MSVLQLENDTFDTYLTKIQGHDATDLSARDQRILGAVQLADLLTSKGFPGAMTGSLVAQFASANAAYMYRENPAPQIEALKNDANTISGNEASELLREFAGWLFANIRGKSAESSAATVRELVWGPENLTSEPVVTIQDALSVAESGVSELEELLERQTARAEMVDDQREYNLYILKLTVRARLMESLDGIQNPRRKARGESETEAEGTE